PKDELSGGGTDPSKRTSRLGRGECARLHTAVTGVLGRALAASGTTVRDYRTGTGASGRFQFELKVYGRARQPCVVCGRRLTTTHAIDGRQTTLCATCQR